MFVKFMALLSTIIFLSTGFWILYLDYFDKDITFALSLLVVSGVLTGIFWPLQEMKEGEAQGKALSESMSRSFREDLKKNEEEASKDSN